MPKLIDLTGDKFGKLTVIRRFGIDNKCKPTWLCKCECGNETVTSGNNLRRGIAKSCGCNRRTTIKDRTKKKYPDKNPPSDISNAKYITTSKGEYILVDEDDYDYLNKFNWRLNSEGYAQTNVTKNEVVSMHTLIMKPAKGCTVGFISKNKFDCRKKNLRYINSLQKVASNKPISTKLHSKYKGVTRQRDKWIARVQKNGVIYRLGIFNSEIAAAKAYNEKALELFGEYAYLNKIIE